MSGIRKAYILVLAGRRESEQIPVNFNPAEYSIESSATYQASNAPGMPSPLVQFVSGNADALTLELFFDTYTDEGGADVRRKTEKVRRLTDIDPDLHAPPPVRFCWGTLQFQAVVERVTQKFTMFLADGTPVRATLGVSFKEHRTIEEQLVAPQQESPDLTKVHVVREGESLWQIAQNEYGNPAEWRVIAAANDLDQPLELERGRALRLPPLGTGTGRAS
ncbi:MAG: LysM peptidoglycan-binding domain-containing protein [Planctomycetes bacterium]|nr:LysM peptidoglycan-binding domain-containing protein [Planctomycetota bacterium]